MVEAHPARVFLDAHHRDLFERIREFVVDRVKPLGDPESDAAGREQARTILSILADGDCYTPIVEQDWRACCVVREVLAATSPLADAVFALQALGITPMLMSKHERSREEWIPGAAAGNVMTAFAMTEVGAGSDVTAMETTAKRDGDHYVITGSKTLISNAGIADLYVVYAVTDHTKGRHGVSCFAVPAATEGLEFVNPQIMSAPHPLGELHFNDCRVPADAVLGAEGEGLTLGFATLERLRPTVGAAACGMAARALAEALTHAHRRQQFGKPLGEFQLIKLKLARMATELDAARLLVYRAAWELDHGPPHSGFAPAMAKAYATEAAQRIVDDAVQIIGGRGVLIDHPVDHLYRAVRALRIYEGTTEIQQLIVARHLLEGGA